MLGFGRQIAGHGHAERLLAAGGSGQRQRTGGGQKQARPTETQFVVMHLTIRHKLHDSKTLLA
jgi:hypothetical protein